MRDISECTYQIRMHSPDGVRVENVCQKLIGTLAGQEVDKENQWQQQTKETKCHALRTGTQVESTVLSARTQYAHTHKI